MASKSEEFIEYTHFILLMYYYSLVKSAIYARYSFAYVAVVLTSFFPSYACVYDGCLIIFIQKKNTVHSQCL